MQQESVIGGITEGEGSRKLPLLVLRRVISLFDCVLLAQVFPMLGLTVPSRAFLVINMGLSIDPHLAGPATRSLGCLRSWYSLSDIRWRSRCCWARSRGSVCRGSGLFTVLFRGRRRRFGGWTWRRICGSNQWDRCESG